MFFAPTDRQEYIGLLVEYARNHGMAIWAWCLMTNHVHFVAVPHATDSMSNTFRDAHTAYATRLHLRKQLEGHLWQGRFFSTVLDEPHLWAAIRYVERNPVRAGLVTAAEDYPWSSAASHCGLRDDPLACPFLGSGKEGHGFSGDANTGLGGTASRAVPGSRASVEERFQSSYIPFLRTGNLFADWRDWLKAESEDDVAVLRASTLTGRPCGAEQFVKQLEVRLRRSLLPQKRGQKARVESDENAGTEAL